MCCVFASKPLRQTSYSSTASENPRLLSSGCGRVWLCGVVMSRGGEVVERRTTSPQFIFRCLGVCRLQVVGHHPKVVVKDCSTWPPNCFLVFVLIQTQTSRISSRRCTVVKTSIHEPVWNGLSSHAGIVAALSTRSIFAASYYTWRSTI